jgi:hypothetical protein
MVRPSQVIRHAWNVFVNQDPDGRVSSYGSSSAFGGNPSVPRLPYANDRSLVTAIYTRIAVDVSSIDVRHVRLDDDDRFKEEVQSYLNECLSTEANIDQTGRALILDAVLELCSSGVAAICPVDYTVNPNTSSFDIKSMRVGKVVDWFPDKVKVLVYDEKRGDRFEVVLDKERVALVYNPLYQVMNQPNSTLQRLIARLNLLDQIDNQSASNKLDLIVQLPFSTRTDQRRSMAQVRREELEQDLSGSKYGVAWIDVNEKVTQLNRPAENSIMKETIPFLIDMLYGQLGLTPEVMNGTADEATMLNYINRTIDPMLKAITEEMRRKFLTKTARTQKQSIAYFRDPFKLISMADLAEIADVFARNEIAASNELRQVVGWKPSTDPKANELRNSNMPRSDTEPAMAQGMFDEMDLAIDEAFSGLE